MTSPRETVLCQYHYDPLDRLIGHALPDFPERQRFYCKSRLATEILGAFRQSIVQHGDLLLAQQQRQSDGFDTTLLATDQQRSVLRAFREENQRHPIAYSPYGHRPAESGLTSLLGFNGERPDPVTGHYLLGNGYRAFNPALMRFNSPDSYSPFGNGGLNAYAYCLGDPINNGDPSGRVTAAALAHARKTRQTNIFKHGSATTKILPDISTEQAMQARDKILKIENKLNNIKLQEREAFNKVYESGFPESQSFRLQGLAEESMISNRVAAQNLHSKAVDFIKQNVKPGYFGFKDLQIFAEGRKVPIRNHSDYQQRAVEIAKETIAKISNIRDPRKKQLENSWAELVKQNFQT